MSATGSPVPLSPPAVAVYARVSTGAQYEENQIPDVERLIAVRYHDAHVVTYREKKSARKKRPEFERMLADAHAGRFSVLVVWKLDRFGRSMAGNVRDVLDLERAGVRVVSVLESWLDTQGPVRDLLLAIFSWIAQQELETLRERVAAGNARVRAAGGVVGTVGFGVKLVRDEAGIPRAVLDDAARPTLIRLAHAFVEARTYRGAALRVNAARDSSWSDHRVRRVLRDERLRGLGAWPDDLLAKIEPIVAACEARVHVRGAAEPKHLASPFLCCGVCGSSLTIKPQGGGRAAYMCTRRVQRGTAACVGVGGRSKDTVDAALVRIVAPALSGAVRRRALQIARQELLSERTNVASERDAVAAALAEAEAEGANLARAIAKGGKLEPLVDALAANDKAKKGLRARLARLEAAPESLDARRRLAEIEWRLDELGDLLDKGDIRAAPAVRAVLQGSRLRVTPVIVDGVRRWGISGWIPAGYIMGIDRPSHQRNDATQGERPRSPRARPLQRRPSGFCLTGS